MPRSYWVETLGCPKNQVDSDKLTGTMLADGLVPAESADEADLVIRVLARAMRLGLMVTHGRR